MTPFRFRAIAAAFLALGAAAFAGFWKPYLTQLAQPAPLWLHAHAAAMALWLGLLIAQPLLLARGRRQAHRRLGAAAWVLAPFIVVAGLMLALQMTQPRPGAAIEPFRYMLFFVQIVSMALWGLAAALALAWRRVPALHARLMICTGLMCLDPVLARVFAHGTPGVPLLVAYGSVVASLVAFAALAWADRRAAQGRWVFAGFGALNLAMQAAALRIEHWAPWRSAMERWLA